MNNFIAFLRAEIYWEATRYLADLADGFEFSGTVPAVCRVMQTYCPREAEIWSIAYIHALANKFYINLENERSVQVAKKLVDTGAIEDLDIDVSFDFHFLKQELIQQIAQVAFYYVSLIGLLPEHINENPNWWVMPRIGGYNRAKDNYREVH